MHVSIIFCIFAIVIEITIATIGCGSEKPEQVQFSLALHDGFHSINPIYSPLKHNIMNKTWKTILQVISYIIAAILGAAGEAVMM